jgi:hypothetical protein
MMISLLAISKKGKSRIGSKLTTAFVEQDFHDCMFIVIRNERGEVSQCRWIKKTNDPDFRIVDWD